MTNYNATVHVSLRSGIADPQGETIERALPALGYEGVSGVRVGKLIEFELNASDAADDLLCVDLGGRRIIKKKIVDELDHIYVPRNDPGWLRRNALLAAGNARSGELVPSVERFVESDDPML